MNVADRFGRNLWRCRRRVGFSQEQLALRASLHRTEISNLERGLRVARIDTFVKIADSLEASADELLEGIGWQPGEPGSGRFTP